MHTQKEGKAHTKHAEQLEDKQLTCSRNFSPNLFVSPSSKQSMRDAIEHLFARYRDIRPLFFAPALPMKVEWKIRPYLGVLPRVLMALQAAKASKKNFTSESKKDLNLYFLRAFQQLNYA
mmetsp:Transcript_23949/g.40163  ORF Transcript_23949/g.40163 Transcript_23949/m.40163 type:complete len:120 (+) Transcript_23949:2856-3215(+)